MTKQERFIPIQEANTPRLRTTLSLPFGVEDSIGINVKQIQRLSQIAGIRHVRIKNDENAQITSGPGMIVGADVSGTAILGRGITTRVPTYNQELQPTTKSKNFYKNADWENLTISLNTKEIKQRILGEDKDVRDSHRWATELNSAVTSGIVRAGVKHLVTNLTKMQAGLTLLVHANNFGRLLTGDIAGYVRTTITDAAIFNFIGPTSRRRYGYGSGSVGFENFEKGEGYRISMFTNFQIDRAIFLLLMSTLQPLAKEIYND